MVALAKEMQARAGERPQQGPAAAGVGWRDLRLVPIASAVWLGAAWSVLAPSSGLPLASAALWTAVVVTLFAGAAALLLATPQRSSKGSRKPLALATLAVAVALGAGFAAGAARLGDDIAGPAGDLLAQGGDANVVLELLSEPRRQQSHGPYSTTPRYLADARLLSATHGGLRFTSSARVVIVGEALEGLGRGERIQAPARFKGGRVDGTGFVTLRGTPDRVGSPASSGFVAAARQALRDNAAVLPPDAAGLVPALAAGDRSKLDPGLEQDLRSAGLSHLTAVSGANFAIVLGTVGLFLRAARLPRWAVGASCGVALCGFIAMVGPEASVLRAGAMGAVGLVALVSGRRGTACAALSTAVAVILLIDPALALSYGFVLSVLATLGITFLGPRLAAALSARAPAWIAVTVAVPLSAQLACGPVVVLLDPSFQTWALLANILASPLVPPITIAATLSLALGTLCPPVAWLSVLAAGPPAVVLAGLAHGMAALPGARLPWAEGATGAAAMAAVSAVNLALVLMTSRRSTTTRSLPPHCSELSPNRKAVAVRPTVAPDTMGLWKA